MEIASSPSFLRNRVTASVCFIILTAASGSAESPKTAEPASIRIASSALALDWTKKPEGWALGGITAGGIPLTNPQGFTNILFSAKKPSADEVAHDTAGENSTFHFSEATPLSETSVRFRHSLPVADVESVWETDAEYPTDIRVHDLDLHPSHRE